VRRPRGPGGRFLTEEQLRKTRTGSNLYYRKEENATYVAGAPTEDEKGERTKWWTEAVKLKRCTSRKPAKSSTPEANIS